MTSRSGAAGPGRRSSMLEDIMVMSLVLMLLAADGSVKADEPAVNPLQEVMVDFWRGYFGVDTTEQPANTILNEGLRRHALGSFRHLLGVVAYSRNGPDRDGSMKLALDTLMADPDTARSVAMQLVQHFVGSDAPMSLVNRVAATFTTSNGDIMATLRAIANDPTTTAMADRQN